MTSINRQELQNFNDMACDWWNPEGSFKPLHQMNPARLKFIRHAVVEHFKKDPEASLPFKGLRMLDVGCGGGLITEPLTRLGAAVTGLDASDQAVEIATAHAKEQNLSIHYQQNVVEEIAQLKQKYDVVLALEIIEHVADPDSFLKDCASLVKPGGLLILSTLNRTLKSWALAIVGAEYVLRWVPRGTHEWEKFLRPSEIARMLRFSEMRLLSVKGLSFHPFSRRWTLTEDTSVDYILTACRDKIN